MGWAANPARKAEALFSLNIVQMGARTYLASLGRFLQVDPVEGGTANAYVYANDPVNSNDYNGRWVQFVLQGITWLITKADKIKTAVQAFVDKARPLLQYCSDKFNAGVTWVSQKLQPLNKIQPKLPDIRVPQKAYNVLNKVENTGTSPYRSSTFLNDGRNGGQILPKTTTYREYDINPKIYQTNRGPERLVIGEDGTAWYTNNHYETFIQIK